MLGLGMGFSKFMRSSGSALTQQIIAAQRSMIPQQTISGSVITSRATHYAHPMGTISNLKLIYLNWYYNGSGIETNVGNGANVTASIEYPSGTFTQVTFSGSVTGSITNGGILTSDSIGVSIPAATKFWVRTCFTPSGGTNIPIATIPNNANILATEDGNNNTGDLTMSGTFSTSTTPNTIRPAAIIGDVAAEDAKGFVLAGDSICWGAGDVTNVDSKGGSGYLARSVISKGAYTKICRGNQGVNDALSNTTKLQAFIAALGNSVTDVINQYGVNDLRVRGDLAELQADTITYLGLYTGRKYQATITPRTSSTDSYVTTENQTQREAPWDLNDLNDFNDWVRAGSSGADFVIEAADSVMSARNSGLWRANNPGLTTDGTHPTTACAASMASTLIPTF